MFITVGRWCARRPKRVAAAWLLLLAAALTAVLHYGQVTSEAVVLPGSDSQAAKDTGDSAFPGSPSGQQPLVLHTAPTAARLDAGAQRTAVEQTAQAVARVPHVVGVTSFLDQGDQSALSADGHTGYLSITLDMSARDITAGTTSAIVAAAAPATAAGLQVTPGGNLATAADQQSTDYSEVIGLAAALIVLLIAFRNLVAAGLPLLAGGIGLGITLPAIGLIGHLMDIPSAGQTLAAMIGLGVGIDYTLFCLTRFRELRAAGVPVEEAAARTTAGSGKAVAFAGSSIVAALTGLCLGQLPLLYALALAPAIAVLVAMAVNLTLLPAALALLGHRLGADRTPGAATDRPRGWAAIARAVTARPWRALAAALALLALLALPAARLAFGQIDAGANAAGTDSRTAYTQLADAFGPGVNGPLQVTDTLPTPATGPTDPRLTSLTSALRQSQGVASVSPAQLASDGRHARWQVFPTTAPSDPATTALVHRLRATTLPTATAGSGQVLHVGGVPAAQADLNDRIASRMPLIIGFVLTVAALLLLLAFRSPLVAAKAALMNLLAVGASYGILTAVFQRGHGAHLIGLHGAVPIPGYVPLLMFAVLFGLSMDYEVFLLSAIRESYLQHGDNRQAVVTGLGRTGRIITSAALIMVSVFLSYLLNDDPVVKMFGIGLAGAVMLDATVVRGILVPATMALLGNGNWWLPRRLDQILPHLDIEGDGQPSPHDDRTAADTAGATEADFPLPTGQT
ncbi:MMPL family transporter [Kitasatospora sp. RB6PN24]|uniref:MMPL family transporter n=1 Tax=Kitasatospora humi TaxID=2893891 RepID=UPI001E648E09|nr:MMPL family transporter [Kitasatospora humi]MCC9305749.1 MMPL family transporter [Kitasatospora humi]